jgi:large-conductance mechanosensitive channel
MRYNTSMDTYSQTQLFFFISSVGFVFLWILVAIFLFYLIRVASTLSRITEKFERDINNIGDTTKELLSEMRDNAVFNFLFGKKKRKK